MRAYRVYADEDGESHLEELDLPTNVDGVRSALWEIGDHLPCRPGRTLTEQRPRGILIS